jgi:hypothetical protein
VERVGELLPFYPAGSKNIMLQMGSDFQYENANEWYKNLDKVRRSVERERGRAR